MEVGKAIYYLLKDSASVGAICENRIYPELAQQDAETPFIAYSITSTTPSGTKNGSSKIDTARVELYIVGDSYAETMDLGIAVRSTLDRQGGDVGPEGDTVAVQSIDFDTSDIDYDESQKVFILEHTYNARVQRVGQMGSYSVAPSNVITVKEADGTPSGNVNTLIVSNGTLSLDDTTATLATGTSYTVIQSAFSSSAGSENVYAPWKGTTEAGSFDYTHQFVCPFNGALEQLHLWRSGANMTSGQITFDLRRVTGASSSGSIEDQDLDAPINQLAPHSVTFSGAQVVAGFVYLLNIRNATNEALGDVALTLVFSVDGLS